MPTIHVPANALLLPPLLPPGPSIHAMIRGAALARVVDLIAADRPLAEWLVDALITRLDALDGDTDLEAVNEDGGAIEDEPHDAEPDEPSLGALDAQADQRCWAAGAGHDLEGATL